MVPFLNFFLQQIPIQHCMPRSRRFLESIKCLLEFANHTWIFWQLEFSMLSNAYFFFKISIEEWWLIIHLIYFKVFVSNKHKKHPNSLHSCNKRKNLLKICAFNLWKTLIHQSFLVFYDFSIFIQLVLEHPLSSYRILIHRSRYWFPCLILPIQFNPSSISLLQLVSFLASRYVFGSTRDKKQEFVCPLVYATLLLVWTLLFLSLMISSSKWFFHTYFSSVLGVVSSSFSFALVFFSLPEHPSLLHLPKQFLS